jgi:hypothetical protein
MNLHEVAVTYGRAERKKATIGRPWNFPAPAAWSAAIAGHFMR